MMRLWDFLKENMMNHPNQLICENDASLTFEEMVIWAESFAEKIKGKKCCAILCHSEMAASMALLACFAAEVTAIPLSMRYGAIHCNKILDAISPDGIIMDDGDGLNVLTISDSTYVIPETPPALMMCTSGTTGKPKGVMLSECNIMTNVEDIAEYFHIDTSDTILIARPLYHCAVLTGEFLTSLVKGCKIRFYSERFNPSKILGLIRTYHVTVFCSTPTLMGLLSKLIKKRHTNSLKHICISGECMDTETALRIADAFPNSKIYHVYGLTEACPRVSYLPPELFRLYPDCVGYPLRSADVMILDLNGRGCRPGEPGILWIKGDNVMIGYYNDPELTAVTLRDGWLYTGDIAVITPDGLLKIMGRYDDLIIKAGMNIYPAEVEKAIRQDPRTREVLVYGYRDDRGVQIGMKIVGNFASVEDIHSLCARLLPDFQRPNRIEVVPELPKNGSGKIIRKNYD